MMITDPQLLCPKRPKRHGDKKVSCRQPAIVWKLRIAETMRTEVALQYFTPHRYFAKGQIGFFIYRPDIAAFHSTRH